MSVLLPVIRVFSGNESLVIAGLEASAKLDGVIDSVILIFYDRGFDHEKVIRSALKAFKGVHAVEADPIPLKLSWPTPQNMVWQAAARWISQNPDRVKGYRSWLWWEADACPIRKGWLDALSSAYKSGRKLFAGVKCYAPDGIHYMNGVGVYPMDTVDALSNTAALYVRGQPFDIVAAPQSMRSFKDISNLIIHERKEAGGTFGKRFNLEILEEFPEAVFCHGFSDGSLHAAASGKPIPVTETGRNTFYHSGDLGDVIYSLPTMRELGGGELFVGPDNRTNMMTRDKLTSERAKVILPLLEAQSYVHSAAWSKTIPEWCRYDLNKMRLLLRSSRLDMQPNFNLARCYLYAFGLAVENDSIPWLTVDSPRTVAQIVIARSPRYRDERFDWPRILSAYSGRCVFIGLKDEHSDFQSRFGQIPFEPTKDLLEVARIIAGASLFVGNQSCPYAIAEGLKKRAILEACPAGSNTIFSRPEVILGCDKSTVLPFVTQKRMVKYTAKSQLIIAGPVDYFTGMGRETCQLTAAAVKRKLPVSLQPLSLDQKRLAIPPEVSDLLTKTVPKEGFRLLVCPFKWIPKNLKVGDTLLTMWESTRLDPEIVAVINQRAGWVIVPSSWCATVFSANGVTVPIHIVPLSVDTEVFKPGNRVSNGVVKFGAAGRLAHGGKRKGIEDVIEAFGMAFPKGDEMASLTLKLFDDCYVPEIKDPRIEVISGVLTDDAMAAFYNSLDCFVCASKAEGWGLHAHEALACGTPVLAPKYSGLADIHGCTWIPFDIEEASEGYSGHWCQPNVGILAANMEDLSGNRMNKIHSTTSLWTPEHNLDRILHLMAL